MKSFRAFTECAPRLLPLSILLLFLLTFPFPSGAQQTQQTGTDDDDDDVVRISTDLVILNITVVDGAGKYVHGLRSSDFKLFEDGQEQKIASFSAEETPFAAAVLLDTSDSMGKRISMARSAAIRFLDGLRTEDVVAVYHFNSKVEQVQDFSFSHDLADMAFGLRSKGMTVLHDAVLRAAEDLSKREEKRRAIVVLSDGGDTRSEASMEKALAMALSANATIFTVDMSSPALSPVDRLRGAGTLRILANKSGGRYIETPGGEALREAFTGIVQELGKQYTIAYRPSNRTRDGRWRTVAVKLQDSNLKARTRQGYRAPKADKR
ncbi:MAG TPA: VWA domain-containing protein [Pyrinomonadaceae bacterium]|jgi:Ca-activated chloride channel family protein|nr:VWA domain-containing protein [Pyrinomonadaceae bacterium]